MSEAQSPVDDVFDLERIRRLIELMKEHDLTELDLRQEEQQIRLCRGLSAAVAAVPMPALAPPPATSAAPASPAAAEEAKTVFIRSPMVGTFYCRANPNAAPFVKVGDHVDENTTVCIVEAMKVFNEIPAEVRGRVVAILAEDEEPVDFGRPLFKVDTSQ